MMRMLRRSAFTFLCCAVVAATAARLPAQEDTQRGAPGGNPAQFAGMQRTGGEVTAVNGSTIAIKAENGEPIRIVITDNTRIMKTAGQGSQPAAIKAADLKAGDGVMAMGNLDAANKTLHAAVVVATDATVVKQMRENFGKTYIAGKVAAIDAENLKMTILRSDGVSQTIAVDESTSFRRGGRGMRMNGFGAQGGNGDAGSGPGQRPGIGAGAAGASQGESITLADIKVGDNVAGQGALKNGLFVPAQLNVLPDRRRAGAAGGASTPVSPQ